MDMGKWTHVIKRRGNVVLKKEEKRIPNTDTCYFLHLFPLCAYLCVLVLIISSQKDVSSFYAHSMCLVLCDVIFGIDIWYMTLSLFVFVKIRVPRFGSDMCIHFFGIHLYAGCRAWLPFLCVWCLWFWVRLGGREAGLFSSLIYSFIFIIIYFLYLYM